jgi:hypothetical protein
VFTVLGFVKHPGGKEISSTILIFIYNKKREHDKMGAAVSSNLDVQTYVNTTLNDVLTQTTKSTLTTNTQLNSSDQTISFSNINACGNVNISGVNQKNLSINTITSDITSTTADKIANDTLNTLESTLNQAATSNSSGIGQVAISSNAAILTNINDNKNIIKSIISEEIINVYNQTNKNAQEMLFSNITATCNKTGFGDITISNIDQDSVLTSGSDAIIANLTTRLTELETTGEVTVTRDQEASSTTSLFGGIIAGVVLLIIIIIGLIYYFTKKDSKGLDQYTQQLNGTPGGGGSPPAYGDLLKALG